MNFRSTSESQTISFAKKFAQQLKGGEVLLLVGDLGAGKTTFTKGLALGLGIKKNITSPTFVLMKFYKTLSRKSPSIRHNRIKSVESVAISGSVVTSSSSIKSLVHIDTYRGLSLPDLENIGALEYLGRRDTIVVIEWGKNLAEYCRQHKINYQLIKISNDSEKVRTIAIE